MSIVLIMNDDYHVVTRQKKKSFQSIEKISISTNFRKIYHTKQSSYTEYTQANKNQDEIQRISSTKKKS